MGLDGVRIRYLFGNISLVSMIMFVLVYLWDDPLIFLKERRYLGML